MTSEYGQSPESSFIKPGDRFRRIIEIVGEVFISIAGIALVGLACVMIRLTSGPVDLNFLNSDVESALNSSAIGVRATIEGTQLAWREWNHPLEIQVKGLHLFSAQNEEILDVPEVGVSLSFSKLLEGKVALKKIRIYSPRIILRRDEAGKFGFQLSTDDHTSNMEVEDFLGFLMIDPENESMGQLNTLRKISILGARLDIVDTGGHNNFTFPQVDLILNRRHTGFDANFKIYSNAESGKIDLLISHEKGKDRADAHVVFSKAALGSMFLDTSPIETAFDNIISHLSKIDIPLSGEAHLAINPLTYEIIEGNTDITLHHGQLSAILEGDLSLGMKSGQVALEMTPHSIILKNLGIYSGEMLLNVQGQLNSPQGVLRLDQLTPPETTLSLNATLKDLPLADLSLYWPSFAAPAAREWIVEHMAQEGTLHEGNFELSGTFHGAGYESQKLQGKLDVKDGAIVYLEGLPPAQGVEGSATFNSDGFDIAIYKGHVGEAQVSEASVKIRGLSNDQEAIDINVGIDARLPEVLKIIDHDPLHYAEKANLDPKRTKGQVKGRLHLDFPLLANLKFDDVKMDLKGTIEEGSLQTEVGKNKFPIDLQMGKFEVAATEKNLTITGPGEVNSVPAKVTWQENFEDGPNIPWRTQMQIYLEATVLDLKRFDYDYTAFLTGSTPFELIYTKSQNAGSTLAFDFNLTPSQIKIPHIGWNKKPGDSTRLQFTVAIEEGDLKHLQNIQLTSGYITASGSAKFDHKGEWQDLRLHPLKFPKTDATLTVSRPQSGGYALKASGKEINAEPFMTYLEESEKKERLEVTPLIIDARLDAIHMGENKTFKKVTAHLDLLLEKKDTVWNAVELTAEAGKGTIDKGQMKDVEGGIWMQITRPHNGSQNLIVRANDAGQFFNNLNIFEDMLGGELTIKASRKVGNPFEGLFKVQNFEVRKIPLLARFAAVASPIGFANLFSDGVVSLNRFDTNFIYGDDIIKVTKGVGKSLSLGFSVEGQIDRLKGEFNLKGAIAPLYVINSVLGHIPLIGSLINGKDGEGLFAASYTVTGTTDEPQVNINPLSALVPVFIRNLFNDIVE
ncbi:AsmA-like C-terminal domain-containing protein [Candidatus Bealeia paramacronuclearis]|uniref:AsmA-like C-terminal domain-containing protein n=1 Tax=Candidatus Bealeia paramacronuclearis TaxID=1921001 RepID=A0ABZ2C3C7_9PROT|nr:hypothetical protein [Candidatus Bealeia paramacronuclearis]